MVKIKILELCHFSAGTCGVWSRVKAESLLLKKKGYDVKIFSSNFIKGSKELAEPSENINGIQIKRFPATKLGGESFISWNFKKDAKKYAPDIIIAHVYRHLHTTRALEIKRHIEKSGKKCLVFLVTHAPFDEDGSNRGLISRFAVKFYDRFIGMKTIKKFDKVIAISRWEISHLAEMGLSKDKVIYLPNGVQKDFFKYSPNKNQQNNKILFLGRISPIKNIELAISLLNYVDDKYFLELVGPSETDYKNKLKNLINNKGLSKRVIFSKPVTDLDKKISKIDSCKFFILPSKREGMPQSLIEAMARGKIVIASDVEGVKDIVKNNKNGFTFKNGDLNSAKKTLNLAINLENEEVKKIIKESKKSVKEFNLEIIINKLDKLINNEINKE